MTKTQIKQFNRMLSALEAISRFDTPAKLRRNDYGLSYQEALEMAYENIIETAKVNKRRIKPIAT